MRQISSSTVLIHLSLIEGLRSQACLQIFDAFKESFNELYGATAYELSNRTSLPVTICEKVVQGLGDTRLLENELSRIDEHRISVMTWADQDYPVLLRHIHAPAPVLYYQGDIRALAAPALAFVGSRKGDAYGQHVIDWLIPEVVKQGFTTISGGALGIDGMVHRVTCSSGGKTVAILGSGLLKPYPGAHTKLFEEIVYSGGLVMSSFPLLTEPFAYNFPARNRIIAGMSSATIVIQAARKSGALLTARNALDEGRDVGVVPGAIFNELSAGCHELLVHGARPITQPQDIFELIGYAVAASALPQQPRQEKIFNQPATKKVSKHAAPHDPLLALCTTPKTMDELILGSGLSAELVQERLWQLQIEGRIEQNMLGMWTMVL